MSGININVAYRGTWRIFRSPAFLFKCIAVVGFFLQTLSGIGQVSKRDTINVLAEDTVYTKTSFGSATATVTRTREYHPASSKNSVVQLINSIPGVRMEERSPGSYRLNMRGSSLRSPFGVRNVKVYWNDIPLTDPGGNTYFNQLAFNNFNTVTFEKSTSSTIYGSGTGGQVLIANMPAKKNEASIELSGGSYNLKSLLATATIVNKNVANRVSYAHNEADGYRKQSAMRRDNLSWLSQVKLSDKQQLLVGLLFTDMYYQTPGGLTLAEYQSDPQSARPAAGIFPSAVDAKAAIRQKNLTAGITYTNKFTSLLSNTTSIYGSYNRIENSAIRNFEKRNEPHYGGRSLFTFNKELRSGNVFNAKAGVEVQSGDFNIKVLGNKNGNADTLQTNDNVNTISYSVFSNFSYTIPKKWHYTASLSYNKSRIRFKRLSDEIVINQPFSFSNELVPRFGILRWIGSDLNITALISKGFSPPSIAELLPSTGVINTELQAEKGWNYELIVRAFPFTGLSMEASLFSFRLKDAIVQRRDEAGADYFVNAGGTQQKGMEWSASYNYYLSGRIVEDGFLRAAYTYNLFKYDAFIKNGQDFSGKNLPGLPANTLSIISNTYFKKNIYCAISYYGASSVFLDDANSVSAKPYHLLMAKVGIDVYLKKKKLNLYVGADNLLNENYSLGNDINAAGGRYYNAAPRRNYYAGAAFSFTK